MSTAAATLTTASQEREVDAALPALLRCIAGNRFLPHPPAHRRGSGDGDFRAIGCEFLGYFVRLCGLRPHESVLDLGCGIGRIAIPLTQYLNVERGRYLGLDLSADGVHWCHENVTQVYPNFRFHHLDVHHPIYNPNGPIPGTRTSIPLVTAETDFVCMISVVTHLLPEEVVSNAMEIARVLRPAGRCLVSAFLVTEARARRLRDGGVPRLPFQVEDGPSPWFADAEHRTAAVAYDEAHLLELFAQAGLRLSARPVYGHWAGGQSTPFQDLLQFHVGPGGPP